MGSANDNFGNIGFVIVEVFVAAWVISAIIYRLNGYDKLDIPTPAD